MVGATRPPIITLTWNSDSLGSVGTQLAHRPHALGQQHQQFQNTEKSPLNLTLLPFSVYYKKTFFFKFQMKFTLSAALWLQSLLNWYWFGASVCSTSGYATAGTAVISVHSSGADWEVLQMHALWVLTDWSGTCCGDSRHLKMKSCEETDS